MAVRSFLLSYSDESARNALLLRYPEFSPMLEAITALLMAHDAGQLRSADKAYASQICAAFRQAVGIIQDIDNNESMPVDISIALSLVKRMTRDAALIFPWPFTPAGSGQFVTLSPSGGEALQRLLHYDPVRDAPDGVPYYNGIVGNIAAVLRDLNDVARGVSLVQG